MFGGTLPAIRAINMPETARPFNPPMDGDGVDCMQDLACIDMRRREEFVDVTNDESLAEKERTEEMGEVRGEVRFGKDKDEGRSSQDFE